MPERKRFFSLMSSLIPRLFWDKIFRDQYWDFFRSNFLRLIPRLFCRPKFSRSILRLLLRPILRLFLRLKFFEADTETFFKTKFFETNTLGKKWEKFWYWEVSRRDVTLWPAVQKRLCDEMLLKRKCCSNPSTAYISSLMVHWGVKLYRKKVVQYDNWER